MFVNFFDRIVVGASPEAVLENCKAVGRVPANELSLVPRETWHDDDVYAMRGARFSGFVICDGEARMSIWHTCVRGGVDA